MANVGDSLRRLSSRYRIYKLSDSSADVATPTFVSVEVVEVGDDDRDRQRDGEDAGDDAESADQLAPDADRRDVAVAHGRHRHNHPPERSGA